MNDTSKKIVNLVHAYNRYRQTVKVGTSLLFQSCCILHIPLFLLMVKVKLKFSDCCRCLCVVCKNVWQLLQVAYTFDAGPNACLYMLDDSVNEVVSLVAHYFPPSEGQLEVRGIPVTKKKSQVSFIS